MSEPQRVHGPSGVRNSPGSPLRTDPGEGTTDVLRVVLAVLFPPLGVFLEVGLGKHFWLNVLLTLLGYIPGIVHAVWVILKK
jgi:uncharacterized membrane protein YqaE (UPF0057 family)